LKNQNKKVEATKAKTLVLSKSNKKSAEFNISLPWDISIAN